MQPTIETAAQGVGAVGSFYVVYGLAVTLVGVVLGTAYRELQCMKQAGHRRIRGVRQLVTSVVYSIDFWMGLCGSPILFSIIWQSAGQLAVGPLTIIAIQNGFCCTLVLPALLGRKDPNLASLDLGCCTCSQTNPHGQTAEEKGWQTVPRSVDYQKPGRVRSADQFGPTL